MMCLRLADVWLVLEGSPRGIETDSRALPMVGNALPVSYTLTGSLSSGSHSVALAGLELIQLIT